MYLFFSKESFDKIQDSWVDPDLFDLESRPKWTTIFSLSVLSKFSYDDSNKITAEVNFGFSITRLVQILFFDVQKQEIVKRKKELTRHMLDLKTEEFYCENLKTIVLKELFIFRKLMDGIQKQKPIFIDYAILIKVKNHIVKCEAELNDIESKLSQIKREMKGMNKKIPPLVLVEELNTKSVMVLKKSSFYALFVKMKKKSHYVGRLNLSFIFKAGMTVPMSRFPYKDFFLTPKLKLSFSQYIYELIEIKKLESNLAIQEILLDQFLVEQTSFVENLNLCEKEIELRFSVLNGYKSKTEHFGQDAYDELSRIFEIIRSEILLTKKLFNEQNQVFEYFSPKYKELDNSISTIEEIFKIKFSLSFFERIQELYN